MKHLYQLVMVLIALTSSHLSSAQAIFSPQTPVSSLGACDGSIVFVGFTNYPGWNINWYENDTTTLVAAGGTTISNLCAGVYVLVLDSAGYTEEFMFAIGNPCSSLSLTTVNVTDCTPGNCDGVIEVTQSNGIGSINYYLDSMYGTPQLSPLFAGLCSGTHFVECEDLTGCIASVAITITDPSITPLVANVTTTNDNTLTCSGTALAAPTGGAGGYTYLWSTGETTSSISNLCAGSYSVLITDAIQDSAYYSFTITNPCSNIALSASATNATAGNCDGTIQVNVTGGTAPYVFSISGGPQTGQSLFSGLCGGTYIIYCTDAMGCMASTTVTIVDTSLSVISPSLVTANTMNNNCMGYAEVTPSGGTGGPYSYLWSTGEITSAIGNLCAGNYWVTIDDGIDTITVTFNITDDCLGFTGLTSYTPASGPGMCDATMTFTPYGGTAPYTYNWSVGGATTQSISNVCGGYYTVFCTDAMGCTTNNLYVSVTTTPPAFSVNLTTTDDLTGNCIGGAQVAPAGAAGPFYYLWSTGETTSAIGNLCVGSYSVQVWNGTDTITTNFTITDPCVNFTATFNETGTINGNCMGSSTITASGGTAPYEYSWDGGVSFNSASTYFSLCPGNYDIVCRDQMGCELNQVVTISDTTIPINLLTNLVSTDDLTNNCSGSASVSPSGGIAPYTIEWSNGSNSNSISNLCAGVYSVTIWDAGIDSTTVNFVIADSSSTYSSNPYPNGPINDTLYTDLVTNCMIDYTTIDSTALYQAVYNSSTQSLYVTWAVYSPTDTVYISDTLALIGNPGYYNLTISVYCPNKSGNDFFKIEQVIYFDGSQVWMSTLEVNEQAFMNQVIVYPNPFSNSISIDNTVGVIRSLKLVDLNGRVLLEMSHLKSGVVEMNALENLSSGSYFVVLFSENASKTVKVIK